MVKILTTVIRARLAELLEIAGATSLVYGMFQIAMPAGWIALGAALALKSFELDMRSDS